MPNASDAMCDNLWFEGTFIFCTITKTGKVIINTLIPAKYHTISRFV